MTTLAFDGIALAADRLSCHANLKQRGRKIHQCGQFVYACCGAQHDTIKVQHWLTAGAIPGESPTLEGDGSWGIVVTMGEAFLVQGKQPALCPVREKFVADGSGRDFALSAMHLGKSAREAVAFAARFDVYTGGGVDAFDLCSECGNQSVVRDVKRAR